MAAMNIESRLKRLEQQTLPPGVCFAGVTKRGDRYTLDLWQHIGDKIEMLPWSRSGTSEDDILQKLKERLQNDPITVFFSTAATWEQDNAGAWQEVKPIHYKTIRICPGGKYDHAAKD
jgi:hypothetical protein